MKRHNDEEVIGPVRTCVGCRKRHGVEQLIRITMDSCGQLVMGHVGRGRGVWLCRDSPHCVSVALSSRAVARGLKVPVAPESLANLAKTMGIEVER